MRQKNHWANGGDSATCMPDIDIPGHRNRDDKGIGSQSGLTECRSRYVRTQEDRLHAVEGT